MTPWAEPWVDALVGQNVGGYRICEFIDAGQFGLVFSVINTSTEAEFAMKIHLANNDPFSAGEFDNEGVLLRKLVKCSSVISIVDSGNANLPMLTGNPPMQVQVQFPIKYIVLAIASGTLEELTADPEALATLAWSERVGLWRGAIKGVHQMHLKSVAHRDLKSSNCLIVVQGNRSEARLADLGKGKDFSTPHTAPPQDYLAGRGDRRFAPPEYLWMKGGYTGSDFRNADLYGLGSLFVELVTGHPMTSLAIGSWTDAVAEGQRDLAAGYERDLSVLRPQFRRAIEEIAEQLPPAIREDVCALVSQLCDPVPAARQPPRRTRERRLRPDPGLDWLLRRADILSRRLLVDKRSPSYTRKTKSRSA